MNTNAEQLLCANRAKNTNKKSSNFRYCLTLFLIAML